MANPYENFGYAGSQPAPAPQAENPYASIGHADTQATAGGQSGGKHWLTKEEEAKIMPDYFGDALCDVALAVTSPLGFGAGALEAGAGVVAKTLAGPVTGQAIGCLLYTSPSPRDRTRSRMPSSA